jgi:uncharacterized protein YdeI (YjbR/CyaY-like superfamily)
MKKLNYFHAKNRAEWRSWLEKNYDKLNEVWLIFDKKHTGDPCIAYDDAVEEAISFGWIDSIIQNINRWYRKRDQSLFSAFVGFLRSMRARRNDLDLE